MKRRHWMRKGLSAVLYAALAMSLTACGNVGNGSTQDTGAQKESVSSEAASAQEGEESTEPAESEATGSEPDGVTYPLDTTDTLSIWQNNQINFNNAYSGYEESPFHTGLAERTGVEVEWQSPVQGVLGIADTQAYNLLLTEEVLPDIIFTSVSSAEGDQLIEDGIIYDLTEYLPLYAPDYWAHINSDEDIMRSLKTEKGKFFNIGQFPEGDYNITFIGPVIRQDWLDECNLDSPVTMADWENVLTVFKERYNAAFGFLVPFLNNGGIGSGTGAYGTFGAVFYIDDDGKVQLAQAQPEWREYMETLHRWYDLGLIDKDSVTMDDSALRTKVLNNEIGISFTAMSRLSTWTMDAENEGTGANWVGLAYPRIAPSEPTCMISTRAGRYQGWGAMVTTSCPEEKLATALNWLNYGYTQEGMMYWNYGEEGVSYTLDENGEPQWTELVTQDPLGVSDAISKYVGVVGSGITIQQSHFVQIKNVPKAAEAVYTWIDNTEGPSHCVPLVGMTDEEAVEYNDKLSPISTRIQEMGLKFMTGDESLDNYDAFVEELNGMGLQDCIDIMQAAYNRYLER